jgi:hypothetical protein
VSCIHGSVSGCAWSAAALVPAGRLGRLAKAADDAARAFDDSARLARAAKAARSISISKVAPDWATKGAHIHVGGVELAVRPGAEGAVVFKPVFSGTSAIAASRAIAQANAALDDPTFRDQLFRDVVRGRDYLGSQVSAQARAKSGELNFLAKALESR